MASQTKKIKKNKSSEEKRIVELVDELYKDSEDFYQPVKDRWNTFERLYTKGASQRNVPKGRANLELPIAFQQIEPFVDHLSELMFPEAPYIKYRGRTTEDDAPAEMITEYVQHQLEYGNFYPETIGYFRNLGKFGNAVMKVIWDEDQIERGLTETELSENPEDESRIETLFDGCKFYNLSLWEFIIPKASTHCDIQKMPWVAHVVWRDPELLLDNPNYKLGRSKIKKYLKEGPEVIRETQEAIPNNTSKRNRSLESSIALHNSTYRPDEKHQGQWMVLEWWGELKLNEDDLYKKPALVVVAYPEGGEPILLRKDENPFQYKFKPFVMSYDYRIEGEAYGYGELNHIKSLINEATALRNGRLDRTNISLNSMWLVERDSGINLRELYTAPDKIVLCDDKQGIERLDFRGANQASVEELSRIEYDIQNTTETLNPRQDVSHVGAAFGRTATGISYLASRGQLRLTVKAKILQHTFIRPLARLLLWYNREFVEDKVFYRVTNDRRNPFRQITPEAFLADVDYIPESTPLKATLAERRENLAYLLQVLGQIEKVKPNTFNFRELGIETFKVTGYNHPERFVMPEGPTIVVDMGQGQLVDEKGQPVQVVPFEQLQAQQANQQAPTDEVTI